MDHIKQIIEELFETEYVSRRRLPHIVHNNILLNFKSVFERLGFEVFLEPQQKYHKNKKAIIGRIDMFVIKGDETIALEYDAGSYWEIRSIRKLSEVNSDFVVLILGSGSIYNQYKNNIYKRLFRLKDKKGLIASLRLKEVNSIDDLINFYKLSMISTSTQTDDSKKLFEAESKCYNCFKREKCMLEDQGFLDLCKELKN